MHTQIATEVTETIDMGIVAATAEQIDALIGSEQFKQVDADSMTAEELEAATAPEVSAKVQDAPESPIPAIVESNPTASAILGLANPVKAPDNSKDVAQAIAPADATWLADGMDLGKVFNEGDTTRRVKCLEYAPKYYSNDRAMEDFLKAFKETLGGTPTARQTASKIKAIFQAYGVKSKELVDGFDPATKEPRMVTKSGKDWLLDFKGTFEKFYERARDVRGKVDGQGSHTGSKKVSITDGETAKVVEAVVLANPEQAKQVIEKATDALLKYGVGAAASAGEKDVAEKRIVIMMFDLTARLADSENLVYRGFAEELRGKLNDFDNARLQAEETFKQGLVTAASKEQIKAVGESKTLEVGAVGLAMAAAAQKPE